MTRQQLIDSIRSRRSFLCVGLDTDLEKVPPHLLEGSEEPIFAFNKAIIDATAPFCVAYKPNLAFYECYGLQGWEALARTVEYLKENYPQHFIIADAKRGDIGNTAAMYARALYEELQVDAVTLAPYMGQDSVSPFLSYEGKWAVLLALTSNKGSLDFQMHTMQASDGRTLRLFEHVLETSQQWADEERMMYVVGATQGKLFEAVRSIAPRHFLLVPGVGAQGGSLEEVCRYGMNQDCGLLVNSSRGIIYADRSEQFAAAAAEKASELQQQMEQQLIQHGILQS